MSALIEVPALAEALNGPNPPVVLDASWHMPATGRKGAEEFRQGHISGARFFDIDTIRDTASPYPHMLPAADDFSRHLGALGVRETDAVVVYDSLGLFSAARAWWMLRVMGHRGPVRVLSGGLPAWKNAGLALASGEAETQPVPYLACLQPGLLADWRQTDIARRDGQAEILDARSAPRFTGAEAEPRPGLRAGHIPGSMNVHYARLVDAEGKLQPKSALEALFEPVRHEPVIASCGSGVTACILALGLHEIGHQDVRVYDGSWAEWGSRTDLPISAIAPGSEDRSSSQP